MESECKHIPDKRDPDEEKRKRKYIVDGEEIEVDEEKGETLEQKLASLKKDGERRLVKEKDEF